MIYVDAEKRASLGVSGIQVSYHFPKNKHPEKFRIDEIKALKIVGNEINVLLKSDESKTINLNYAFIPKRNFIREYFETLEMNLA